jgi:tetratricopeptide (TPR) repeat protein
MGEYVEHYEAFARTYPRDAMPVIQLGRIYADSGDFEKALPKFEEAYRLQSRQPMYVTEMMRLYVLLDRFDEAKAVGEKAFTQGVDAPNMHRQLLEIAQAQGDPAAASRQIQWFTGKPEEYLSLWYQGGQAKLLGQMRQSRELLQRAADLARRRNLMDAAAGFLRPGALWDALLGNCETARKTDALSDAILALCGNAALVERAEERNKHLPPGPLRDSVQIPLTRAAEEFGLGHTATALDLLQSVAPYERAYPFANYLRGLAYLRLRKGTEAAGEFQKVLDHRGSNWGPYYPLSYIGMARAAALAGYSARARRAYHDFLTLWKDADPDVPLLIQVRKESATLNR